MRLGLTTSVAAAWTLAGLATAAPGELPEIVLTNYLIEDDQVPGPGFLNVADDVAVTPDGSRLVFSSRGNLASGCTGLVFGAIYIYDYDADTGAWTLAHQIKECAYNHFGNTLSISDDGTTILVGQLAGLSQAEGRAWVFTETDGIWTAVYTPSDPGKILGVATDLDATGDRAVIVAPEQLGSYFLIARRDVNGVWAQEFQADWFSFGGDQLHFTAGCAIDGDWVAVASKEGFDGNPPVEQIRMYHWNGTVWEMAQTIPLAGSWGSGDPSGDIEIEGDRMIVGQGACCAAPGFVRIYERDPVSGVWGQVYAETGGTNDALGHDVAILGDRAIASRRGRNDARLYERIGGVWQPTAILDIPNSSVESGDSVAVMDRGYLVGGRHTIGTQRATVEEYGAPVAVCAFTEDFDDDAVLPPTLFRPDRVCAQAAIDAGALRITLPTGCSEGEGVVQAFGDYLTGDFDFAFDWTTAGPLPLMFIDQFAFPAALTIIGVDNLVEMRIERGHGNTPLPQCVPAKDFHKAWDRVAGFGNCTASFRVSDTLVASYRILRDGTTWRAYVKEPADRDWVLLRTATLTDGPVRFQMNVFGVNNGVLDTWFDNLGVGTAACTCPPDLNGDGLVDSADLAILLGGWGGSGPADLNGDGNVDAPDLSLLLGAWGECPRG